MIAPETAAVEAAQPASPPTCPLVAVGCGTRAPLASVVDRQRGRGGAAPRGTCWTWAIETVHHIGGPAQLAGCPGAGRRLAAGPARGRRARAGSAARGLVVALGLRDRPPARRHARGDRGVRAGTTRWRSACSARWPSTGAAVPGDVSVVGFDDIPEVGLLPAAADHGPPGLRRARPARAAPAAGPHLRRAPAPGPVAGRAGTRRARERGPPGRQHGQPPLATPAGQVPYSTQDWDAPQ